MSIKSPVHDSRAVFHFKRPRINQLFTEAVRYPLIVVCAGAGYGKTSAVHDFIAEYRPRILWVQLSERDNVGARFWENLVHAIVQVNLPLAKALKELSFPNTQEKLDQFRIIMQNNVNMTKRLIVMDDFHFLKDTSVIRFIENNLFFQMPPGTSIILISRSSARINTMGAISKGLVFNISENDLCFTENELALYFKQLDISPKPESLREIMRDTEGWAFAINHIARSYQKAPGYVGYLRSAMKTNIFRLMETDIWENTSNKVQHFLVRLSLIGHLSFDLIKLLADGDESLIADLEKQDAYVRRDSYINAYLIHPLFLEFLTAKQEQLTAEDKRETYTIAGEWCNKNGFKIDALSYYEKTGNYDSIVSIFLSLPAQIPYDIASYASVIFDRAPPQVFDTVNLLAVQHLRSYICQGLWEKSLSLAAYYEKKFLKMPKNDEFANNNLSSIYLCWAYLRGLMCLTDDRYDFDLYLKKFCDHIPRRTKMRGVAIHCPGPWVSNVGTSKKGCIDEYINALSRGVSYVSQYYTGYMAGLDELAWGELKFYQADISSAELHIALALDKAREHKQLGIVHRALIYALRISITQGNYQKAEQILSETKAQLNETEYSNRFINYDISLAIYYYNLGLPEKIPHWINENFSTYSHAGFIENFANQMKACFCYLTRNYTPLIAYIQEMKQRESFVFERVEMLVMEACINYKMKNNKKAFASLAEAYETASPNNLIMPFIEMGKDMRTLTTAALKVKSNVNIPASWLENINRRAASYAKHQGHVIREYRQLNNISGTIVLSPRETEILRDLSLGLTRAEIAASRNLSINTVKMVINNIHAKTGSANLADLIRIAVERKLI